jgi:hypothetical protein
VDGRNTNSPPAQSPAVACKANRNSLMIDRQEILQQLDTEAESYVFPMLDNGYYYHGDQKLTIFRDEKRWAILLEVLALIIMKTTLME